MGTFTKIFRGTKTTISDEDIAELNIPTGIPLVYKLDENFKPVVAGGEYLDPEAAAAGAAAVAAQGNKK